MFSTSNEAICMKFSLILVLSLWGCNNCTPAKKEQRLCIVYCDFTRSIDTGSMVNKIIEETCNIYNYLKYTHELEFYLLGNGGQQSPFFIHKPVGDIIGTPKERKEKEKKEENQQVLLKQMLDSAARIKPVNSCIIEAIEQTLRRLKNRFIDSNNSLSNNVSSGINIIFLSDMLESCKNGNYDILLEKRTAENSNMYTYMDKLKTDGLHTLNFKPYKKLRVYPIFYNLKGEQLKQVRLFWNTVFNYYGVDTTELPEPDEKVYFNLLK